MTTTSMAEALNNHPLAGVAATEEHFARLDALACNIDQTMTAAECTEVILYLEDKIASIMGQLETGRVTAEHRGASDAYLDWHTRAHHALSVSRMQHARAMRHRHHFYELGKIDRNAEHAARLASKQAHSAEQKARNAEAQVEIVRIAAERSVHRRVCDLVRERYGAEIHKELFLRAHAAEGGTGAAS